MTQRTLKVVAFLMLTAVLSLPGWSAPDAPQVEKEVLLANHAVYSPDGESIVFVFESDLWRVPARGGRAEWIVFSSDREGTYDLYAMPADGGAARRITWHGSGSDIASSFSPDGRFVYFYSNRSGYRDLYRVPFGGGAPVQLHDEEWDQEYYPTTSPDGDTIAFCRGAYPGALTRRNYTGSDNADLWLADNTVPLSNFRRLTRNPGHDMYPVWAPDGRGLYYVSGRDGVQNVWYLSTEGDAAENEENARQVTHFEKGDLSHLQVSPSGRQLLFAQNFRLWTADSRTGQAGPLPLELYTDLKENRLSTHTYSGGAAGYAISPDQKKMAYVAGHDIFITPADDNTATRQITRTAARETHPLWFPDSRRLLFLSMQDGNRDFYIYDALLQESTRLTDTTEDESCPVWSPDGKKLAYLRGERAIMIYDTGTGEHAVFDDTVYYAQAGLYDPPALAWSPDGRWIA